MLVGGVTCDEVELRARINNQRVDRDAKRWAIQHLRPAVAGLQDGRFVIAWQQDKPSGMEITAWIIEDSAWEPVNHCRALLRRLLVPGTPTKFDGHSDDYVVDAIVVFVENSHKKLA